MFSYGNEYGHPIGRNHYADANLGLILDIFRSFTGPDWRPVRVETDNRKTQDIHMLEDFLESPVEGQKPALSLIFPAADLDTPNPKTACAREALTLRDIDFLENEKPPISTTEVVTAVVHLRLLGGLTDIAGAAQHLHTGVRTLQRRLSVEGMSYRRILLEQRNARALHLLRETDFSVTDIAVALGYEYAGDFTRAFSRYYGFAPTAIHGRASSQSDLKGPLHVT
jgi:AraC-like DNA-binding protein